MHVGEILCSVFLLGCTSVPLYAPCEDHRECSDSAMGVIGFSFAVPTEAMEKELSVLVGVSAMSNALWAEYVWRLRTIRTGTPFVLNHALKKAALKVMFAL